MNQFVRMFERHFWKVESVGKNSFVAYNDMFFVAFSCYTNGDQVASAVSFLLEDKDNFIAAWKKYNKNLRLPMDIGAFAFRQYIDSGKSKFVHFGGVGNHDHSAYEIESWLERIEFNRMIGR